MPKSSGGWYAVERLRWEGSDSISLKWRKENADLLSKITRRKTDRFEHIKVNAVFMQEVL